MAPQRARQLLVLISVAVPAFVPVPALADWIPLTVTRTVSAEATYMGVTDGPWSFHGDFIGPFDETAEGYVEYKVPCEEDPENGCLVGSSSSAAHQLSNFIYNGTTFSGQTGGSWYGPPSGSYAFENLFHFKFRLLTNHRTWFYFQVDPGEWPSVGLTRGHIKLENAWGEPFYHVTNGAVTDSGFLAPGDYVLEARAWGDQNAETWQGAVYGGWFTCAPDTAPTLPHQPDDVTVACGGTATFSVGTTCAAGTPTYQWRHNLVPLSNNTSISGANGPTLTIQNACTADAGSYDVIVTCAGSSRPSSQARLTVTTTTTGVEPDQAVGPVPILSLRAPTPNPFASSTALRYEAVRPVRVTAAVYDARGARVRSLMNGTAFGSGAIRWDGMTSAGRRAPAGIYFVRVEGSGIRETRKVVLLQ